MIEKTPTYFNIAQICHSGQCFRMSQGENNTYTVIAGDKYVEICQDKNKTTFYCSDEEYEDFWNHYFDLNTDYGAYRGLISSRDKYLTASAELGWGIRILNQDLWEMLVSFLISQQNNIVRIRRCIQNICEKYGEEKQTEHGISYYAFPLPRRLAELGEDELKECNLGYRSKYVVRAAKSVVNGHIDLGYVQGLPYEKAKEELLKLFGVGDKVADCICLFGLHHMEAFPVDTHINKALKAHYPKGFPKRRYKGCEGVMQQYIFYQELIGKKGGLLEN